MQSLCIRVSEFNIDALCLPEATMMRYITSTKDGNFIELVYWFDTYLQSQKQIKWISNIKTKIKMYVTDVEFVTYNKQFNYETISGEPFSLQKFSELWNITTKDSKDVIVKRVKLPPLPYIDTMVQGNIDKIVVRELYRPLLIHSKNLYYYHSFSFEAVMSGINEALTILGLSLGYKLKNKLCQNLYDNFTKELLVNPYKYKQKLLGKDKEDERTNRTNKLIEARINKGMKSVEINKAKIVEAINSNPLCSKPDGLYNITAIARVTNLSRPTITKILK